MLKQKHHLYSLHYTYNCKQQTLSVYLAINFKSISIFQLSNRCYSLYIQQVNQVFIIIKMQNQSQQLRLKTFIQTRDNRKRYPTDMQLPYPNSQAHNWRMDNYESEQFLDLCNLLGEGKSLQDNMHGLIGINKILVKSSVKVVNNQQNKSCIKEMVIPQLGKFLETGQFTVVRFESLCIIFQLLNFSYYDKQLYQVKFLKCVIQIIKQDIRDIKKKNAINEALWVMAAYVLFWPSILKNLKKLDLIGVYRDILNSKQSKQLFETACGSLIMLSAQALRYIQLNQNKNQEALIKMKNSYKQLLYVLCNTIFNQQQFNKQNQQYQYGVFKCLQLLNIHNIQFVDEQTRMKLIKYCFQPSYKHQMRFVAFKILEYVSRTWDKNIYPMLIIQQFLPVGYKIIMEVGISANIKILFVKLLGNLIPIFFEKNIQILTNQQFRGCYKFLLQQKQQQIHLELCDIVIQLMTEKKENPQVMSLMIDQKLMDVIIKVFNSKTDISIARATKIARDFIIFGEKNKVESTNIMLKQFKQKSSHQLITKLQSITFNNKILEQQIKKNIIQIKNFE